MVRWLLAVTCSRTPMVAPTSLNVLISCCVHHLPLLLGFSCNQNGLTSRCLQAAGDLDQAQQPQQAAQCSTPPWRLRSEKGPLRTPADGFSSYGCVQAIDSHCHQVYTLWLPIASFLPDQHLPDLFLCFMPESIAHSCHL